MSHFFKRVRLVASLSFGFVFIFGVGCTTPNPDGIVQNGVEAQMREKSAHIQACYDSEYKKMAAKPKGMVILRLTLNDEGDVRDVVTLEDTFQNPRLTNCLTFIVKAIRFDQAGVTMETFVEYPIVFNNEGKLR